MRTGCTLPTCFLFQWRTTKCLSFFPLQVNNLPFCILSSPLKVAEISMNPPSLCRHTLSFSFFFLKAIDITFLNWSGWNFDSGNEDKHWGKNKSVCWCSNFRNTLDKKKTLSVNLHRLMYCKVVLLIYCLVAYAGNFPRINLHCSLQHFSKLTC